MRIIGLSGKAGSGKDFIGYNHLFPLGYRPFSLAWHFKIWIVGKGLASYDDVYYNKPPAVRKLLQNEGTELGRNVYGENVWCNTLGTWLRCLSETWKHDRFYIPDVRFPNEVEYLQKELGAKVFRINAPERIAASGLTAEARKHISETALDDYTAFDGYIENDPGHDIFVQVMTQLMRYKLQ